MGASSSQAAVLLLVLAALAGCLTPANAGYESLATSMSSGRGTIYGYGQNAAGACSYGSNMADTTGLPWSTPPPGASAGGTPYPMTFIAMNQQDFDNANTCGTCIWFRGTGQGIGVAGKEISTSWQYGFVDNICPECPKGAIDLARSYSVGDGIWNVEWYAVPCQVGSSSIHYSFVASSPYFFNMVISNTRVPVKSASITIGGKSVQLRHSSNNNWVYNNQEGPYTFPLDITVEPVCGSAVKDTIASDKGGEGSAQFDGAGCPNMGNPTSGGGGSSSGSGGSSGSSGSNSSDAPTDAPTSSGSGSNKAEAAMRSQRRAVVTTDAPTSAPTTDAPTHAPRTHRPTKAPTSAPTNEPTHAPTHAPTHEPTSEPTDAPTEAPTDTRQRRVHHRPPPTHPRRRRKSQPPNEPKAPPPSAHGKKHPSTHAPDMSSVMKQLFGGDYNANLGKAMLPKWFQCGDNYGRYPDVECGTPGFSCVPVNYWYMQCRDDAGGPSVQGRKLLVGRQPQ